jgi:hypothetical protein
MVDYTTQHRHNDNNNNCSNVLLLWCECWGDINIIVLKLHAGRDLEQTEFGECLLPFGPESFVFLPAARNTKVKIYKTIILPVVYYGCETWSLTLREEHRLSVFENRVLRRIFGPQRDEVTGEWRKLHNEELHILYSSSNIIR